MSILISLKDFDQSEKNNLSVEEEKEEKISSDEIL